MQPDLGGAETVISGAHVDTSVDVIIRTRVTT